MECEGQQEVTAPTEPREVRVFTSFISRTVGAAMSARVQQAFKGIQKYPVEFESRLSTVWGTWVSFSTSRCLIFLELARLK